MSLKRSYQVPSKYNRPSKRARTLQTQVTTLKKQVSQNKKELKYYDGNFILQADVDSFQNLSIFKDVVNTSGTSDNPTFIGRKAHIKKIELRLDLPSGSENVGKFLCWREKRIGKNVIGYDYPLSLDPEYHHLLRFWETKSDVDCLTKHMTIDFGPQGRLVEFDQQTTATATGDIVSGDIRMSLVQVSPTSSSTLPAQFRVWYTDN